MLVYISAHTIVKLTVKKVIIIIVDIKLPFIESRRHSLLQCNDCDADNNTSNINEIEEGIGVETLKLMKEE